MKVCIFKIWNQQIFSNFILEILVPHPRNLSIETTIRKQRGNERQERCLGKNDFCTGGEILKVYNRILVSFQKRRFQQGVTFELSLEKSCGKNQSKQRLTDSALNPLYLPLWHLIKDSQISQNRNIFLVAYFFHGWRVENGNYFWEELLIMQIRQKRQVWSGVDSSQVENFVAQRGHRGTWKKFKITDGNSKSSFFGLNHFFTRRLFKKKFTWPK